MRCAHCHGSITDVVQKVMDSEIPGLVRNYAARGRVLGTLSREVVEALEEFATRIEQGEPVS